MQRKKRIKGCQCCGAAYLVSSGDAAPADDNFLPQNPKSKRKEKKRSILLMITDTAREEQILSTDCCLPAGSELKHDSLI